MKGNTKSENRENSQGIFFGVIGVATLIVAMIGATMAYFTASQSGKENAVTAKASQVIINYTDGDTMTGAEELIPAYANVASAGYMFGYGDDDSKSQCIDDKGNGVCSIYHFEVENKGDQSIDITGKITVSENGFENLRYMVYDVSDYVGAKPFTPASVFTGSLSLPAPSDDVANPVSSVFGYDSTEYKSVTIGSNQTKKYDLVVFLNNLDVDQTPKESGKTFKATVSVNLVGAQDKIQGTIEGVE